MHESILVQLLQILVASFVIYVFVALPFKCMEFNAKKFMSPKDFEAHFADTKVWFFGL